MLLTILYHSTYHLFLFLLRKPGRFICGVASASFAPSKFSHRLRLLWPLLCKLASLLYLLYSAKKRCICWPSSWTNGTNLVELRHPSCLKNDRGNMYKDEFEILTIFRRKIGASFIFCIRIIKVIKRAIKYAVIVWKRNYNGLFEFLVTV